MRRQILLNPGPVTLSTRVRAALSKDDWCHREPEFADLTRQINADLAAVYPSFDSDYRSVMLTGSGTSAVEAMLATFAPDSARTLVVANGVYGERMARMLAAHDKPHTVVQSEWASAMDLDQVRRHLEQDDSIDVIAAVHHETTTGRLNDLEALGKICRQFDKQLVLDAVSSFGAEFIDAKNWAIAALAATANKCLHGAPGLSFVLAHDELWGGSRWTPKSVYLDLHAYHASQHEQGYSPFTQAVHTAFALKEALDEHRDEGGWEQRRATYRKRADAIYGALSAAGVSTVLPPEEYSSVLRSYLLPDGLGFDALHDRLKDEGFVTYAGQGQFASAMFRIANMGDIQDPDLERLCGLLPTVLGGSEA